MINAGAVMFHGVTDDTLARAAALLGDPDTRRPAARRAPWRPTNGSARSGGATGSTRGHPPSLGDGPPSQLAGAPAPDARRALAGRVRAERPRRSRRCAASATSESWCAARASRSTALDLVGAGTGVLVAEPGLGDLARPAGPRRLPPTAARPRRRISPRPRTGPTPAGSTQPAPNATRCSARSPARPGSADAPAPPAPVTNAPGSPSARRSPPRLDRIATIDAPTRRAPADHHPHRPDLQLRARAGQPPGLGPRLTLRPLA